MEGQETGDLDPHQGKLQNNLAFCTHPDVRGFKGQTHVYTWVWPIKPHTPGCVRKANLFCIFPWCGSNSLVSWPSLCLEITWIRPSITPLKSYIRNPLDTLKAWGIEEKSNYSPLLSELILESTSLCPLEHFCVLPNLSFCLWACYREMED